MQPWAGISLPIGVIVAVSFFLLAGLVLAAPAPVAFAGPQRSAFAAPQAAGSVDSGTVILHLLGREVGIERYELRREGDRLTLSDNFSYLDRGGEVSLDSSLEMAADFTPQRLRAAGRTYRFLQVDVEVEIDAGVATVRNQGETQSIGVTAPVFLVPGYAPLAARPLLIGYWERHGRPALMTTLPGAAIALPGAPGGSVVIEAGGTDLIRVQETTLALRRYIVRGVAWGREVVWLDDRGRLAAIFTRANILPLDGIRSDLLAARNQLEELAVGAYMDELALLSATAAPVTSGAFALAGARLIDGSEREAVEDAIVVVRDGRIVAAGPRASTPIPDGIEIVDASGTTIVPGLWDMHAHAAQIEWAPAYLAAGVTTVRDMGGGFAFLTAFRDTLASGRGLGPRLLLAGLVDGADTNAFGAITASTPEEGRAVVERYHAAGFEQMKLYAYLQPEVVRAISTRAHELGMTVTGHVPRALSLEEALDAGMDQVAHLPLRGDPQSPQAEQTIEALQRHDAAVDPTVSWGELLGRSQDTPIAEFQPAILRAPWPIASAYGSVRNAATPAEVAERLRGSLAGVLALHDAGVPLLAGTDYGVPAHSLHRELELYVAAGLTPLEAIRTATAIPAQVMDMAEDSGTIEVGKRSDMLVLEGNPLADISAIRTGRWVVANGILYACDPLWELAGFAAGEVR